MRPVGVGICGACESETRFPVHHLLCREHLETTTDLSQTRITPQLGPGNTVRSVEDLPLSLPWHVSVATGQALGRYEGLPVTGTGVAAKSSISRWVAVSEVLERMCLLARPAARLAYDRPSYLHLQLPVRDNPRWWAEATDLNANSTWVPLDEVTLGGIDGSPGLRVVDSSGVAVGPTRAFAQRAAIDEFIERLIVRRLSSPLISDWIPVPTLGVPLERAVNDYVAQSRARLLLLLIPFAERWVAACIAGNEEGDQWTGGAACRTSPWAASEHASKEALVKLAAASQTGTFLATTAARNDVTLWLDRVGLSRPRVGVVAHLAKEAEHIPALAAELLPGFRLVDRTLPGLQRYGLFAVHATHVSQGYGWAGLAQEEVERVAAIFA